MDEDMVYVNTVMRFGMLDRIRLLLGGVVVHVVQISTQNKVGSCKVDENKVGVVLRAKNIRNNVSVFGTKSSNSWTHGRVVR